MTLLALRLHVQGSKMAAIRLLEHFACMPCSAWPFNQFGVLTSIRSTYSMCPGLKGLKATVKTRTHTVRVDPTYSCPCFDSVESIYWHPLCMGIRLLVWLSAFLVTTLPSEGLIKDYTFFPWRMANSIIQSFPQALSNR